VNTHLEVADFAPIQVAQTVELLSTATKTHLPVVMVGDFNSSADWGGPNDTLSYEIVRLAGFKDAWSRTNPGDPGFTCCQDADLRNESSALNDRIDFVFTRGKMVPSAADNLGESEGDRTEYGLWPSDHAGVVATLQLHGRRPWFCHWGSYLVSRSNASDSSGRRAAAAVNATMDSSASFSGWAMQERGKNERQHRTTRHGFTHAEDLSGVMESTILKEEALLDSLAASIAAKR
jgi:hypothetical protein